MYTLVIIRHGQSQWNKKNLFCGWTDVDLTEKGFEDARAAGRLLKKEGYTFDICYMAAQRLNWLKDCKMVMAIPVSASSKNPFFDRKPKQETKA